jgi:hypothetical protein
VPAPEAPVAILRITDVHLEREVAGLTTCVVVVKVFNDGDTPSDNVEVAGEVAVRDLSNTVAGFDASDFGGPQTIQPGQETTFIGRSVVIAAGVTASYEVRVTIGSSTLDSASSDVASCP